MLRITTLGENTCSNSSLLPEHGLSLYIEFGGKRILFDAAQSGAFADNAQKLNIDLSTVDIAILSHGHYDHSGGFERFLRLNDKAKLFVSENVFGQFYNGTDKYIGINKEVFSSVRIVRLSGSTCLDDAIEIKHLTDAELKYPIESFGLLEKTDSGFINDSFVHEQYLVLKYNGKRILFSGCSHRGVLNIMSATKPDIFIGGFHFSKLNTDKDDERKVLYDASNELLGYDCTYYTCHCTGVTQYQFMKSVMGEKLHYISTGSIIEL